MTRESDEDLTRRSLYPFYTLADKNEGKEKFTTSEKRYSSVLFDDAGLKVGRAYVIPQQPISWEACNEAMSRRLLLFHTLLLLQSQPSATQRHSLTRLNSKGKQLKMHFLKLQRKS